MSKFKDSDPRSASYRRDFLVSAYPHLKMDMTDEQLESIPQDKFDQVSLNAPPMENWKGPVGVPAKEDISADNIDYSKGMDVKGRMGAANLGDENDPGTIAALQKANPDTQFTQYEGHLFSKGPEEQAWHPFKGVSNPWSDHIADVAKPIGAIAATLGLKVPLTGPGGAIAQGALSGGLEAARQGLGKLTGERSSWDRPQIGLNAAGGALVPIIGAGMGAPILRKAGQMLGSETLANLGGQPGSLAGMLGRGLSKVGQFASGHSADLLDKFLDPAYSSAIKKWTGLNGEAALKQAVTEATQPVLDTAAKSKTYLGSLIRALNDKSPDTISTQWAKAPDGTLIQGPALALQNAMGKSSTTLGQGSSQAMRESVDEVGNTLAKHLPSDPATGQVWNQRSTPSQLFEIEQGLRTEVRPKTSMGQIVSEPSREVKSAATAMQNSTKALRQRSVLDQNPEYTQAMLDEMDSKYGTALDQNDTVKDAFTSRGNGPDTPHAIAGLDRLAQESDPALRGAVHSILPPTAVAPMTAAEAEAAGMGSKAIEGSPGLDTLNEAVGDLKNSGLYYGSSPGVRPSISPKLMGIRKAIAPKSIAKLNELLGSIGQPLEDPGVMSSAYRQVLPNYLDRRYQNAKDNQ